MRCQTFFFFLLSSIIFRVGNQYAECEKQPDFSLNNMFLRVNVTTGYSLVKTRYSRVPTYLKRETDTADWSTPTFTLPCRKNGRVYTLPRLLFPRTVPRFSEMYPDLARNPCTDARRTETLPSAIFSARITFRLPGKGTKTQKFLL